MKLCRNRESSSVANEVGAKDKNIHPHLVCFQKNISLDVNFCKEHRDIIEVPDPLAVEDLISSKLNNKRKLAIFSNISEGTASLLQGVTEND